MGFHIPWFGGRQIYWRWPFKVINHSTRFIEDDQELIDVFGDPNLKPGQNGVEWIKPNVEIRETDHSSVVRPTTISDPDLIRGLSTSLSHLIELLETVPDADDTTTDTYSELIVARHHCEAARRRLEQGSLSREDLWQSFGFSSAPPG